MGKIRKEKRYRLHKKAPEAKESDKSDGIAVPVETTEQRVIPLPEEFIKSESVVSLKTTDPDHQKKSEPIKKKDKRKMRREKWLQRIEVCEKRKEEERAAGERKKTVIVGDMQPLATSLPIISTSGMSGGKAPKKASEFRRTLLSELSHYQDVLKHPAFINDPMATIAEHVQNSVATGSI